ncbi:MULTISPECIES: DUF1836 domain-containing protein [Clostridium]|uniref:DUF1836 domain-containing protein n=1 Tax=Clostridium sporogenes TaxID=1509 RepID=A0A7X5P7C3_CLOSG|nr:MULTISPECIES: DUF1836 domain-containing protein [Clostridium]AJD31159.1 hypothetical protein T258_404 [Clostridium botulinum Prevot_594]STC77664.1 protein of uncharacterised function (DUF1836) [Clostridium botulinum]EHN16430.1 hypothetical protein IYC_03821 [Clostridium sporogenes PA 3679]KOY65348.1 hypothetical protein AN649_14490 [Clostridium sporogenes]KRU46741.1 hypothetical protein VT94_02170 [Clostridium sporogenes]
MEYNEENLETILSNITEFNDIKLSDIPDIDLYMDQVITLFDMKLKSLKRDENDKIMTKTMVNNYAKGKFFPTVKGKKYTKEQIILLEMIYNLKQSLSLSDIETVLTPIMESIHKEENKFPTVEDLYGTFLSVKEIELKNFHEEFNKLSSIIKEKSEKLQGEDVKLKEVVLLIFTLISKANMEKRMAEKLIDNFLKDND